MENSKDLLCDVYLKLNLKRQKGILIKFKLKPTFLKQIILSTNIVLMLFLFLGPEV